MTGEATFCYYNIGGSWGRLFNNVKCEKQHWGLFLIKKDVFTLTYFGKSLIDRWFIQTLSERNVSSYLAPHSSVRGWFINQVYRAFKQMTIAFIFLRLSFTMSRMKPQKEHGDKNRFKKKSLHVAKPGKVELGSKDWYARWKSEAMQNIRPDILNKRGILGSITTLSSQMKSTLSKVKDVKCRPRTLGGRTTKWN